MQEGLAVSTYASGVDGEGQKKKEVMNHQACLRVSASGVVWDYEVGYINGLFQNYEFPLIIHLTSCGLQALFKVCVCEVCFWDMVEGIINLQIKEASNFNCGQIDVG